MDELLLGLQTHLGLNWNPDNVKKLLAVYDVNNDQNLDVIEFVGMLNHMNELLTDRFMWHYHGTKEPGVYLMHRIIFKVGHVAVAYTAAWAWGGAH